MSRDFFEEKTVTLGASSESDQITICIVVEVKKKTRSTKRVTKTSEEMLTIGMYFSISHIFYYYLDTTTKSNIIIMKLLFYSISPNTFTIDILHIVKHAVPTFQLQPDVYNII